MKPALKLLLSLLAILGIWLAVSRSVEKKPQQAPVPTFVRQERPSHVPKLLPVRQATPDLPLQSWERLLAADGTPAEDRAALAEIIINYLQSASPAARPPLGTNEEITRALTDHDLLGDAAIPASHPAIVSGQLVDRWGNPWHFHQQSADLIEVRSAGPDGKLFTNDDLARRK